MSNLDGRVLDENGLSITPADTQYACEVPIDVDTISTLKTCVI